MSHDLAYIYVRWSRAEQSDGLSERRQMGQITDWCRRRKLAVDPSRIYVDRGASGFSGSHLAKGQLGVLVREVELGRVPPGSVLVVEAYDRISRLPSREARRVIDILVDHGIRIGVVSSDELMDAQSGNDLVNEVGMVLRINLAHQESRLKRDRSRANWINKRQDAVAERKVATRGGPRWLTYDDGDWKPNEHAATVRKAFGLCLRGFGATSIAARFNTDQVALLSRPGMRKGPGGVGSQWTSSAVLTILRNPAAYGAWQPRTAERTMLRDTEKVGEDRTLSRYRVTTARQAAGEFIRGYYTAVVSEEDWAAAQRQIDARRNSGGNQGRITNVLAGVIYCAACGGRLQLAGQRAHKHDALYCRDAQLGKCAARGTLRLDAIDGPILHRASDAFELLRSGADPERAAVAAKVRQMEAERASRQAALDLLMATPGGDQAGFVAQFSRAANVIADLDSQIAKLRARVAELEAQKPDDPGMEDLIRAYHGPRGEERDSAIRLLNGALRRVIARVRISISNIETEFGSISAGSWTMQTVGGWATTSRDQQDWDVRESFVDVAQKVAADEAMPQGLRNQMREAIQQLDEMPQAGRDIGARVNARQKSPGQKPRA